MIMSVGFEHKWTWLITSIAFFAIGVLIITFQPKMIKIKATITGKNNVPCVLSKHAQCQLHVKYTVNGKEYYNKLYRNRPYLTQDEGEQVDIEYNPKKPESIVGNNVYNIAAYSMFVIGGLSLIVFGLFLWASM